MKVEFLTDFELGDGRALKIEAVEFGKAKTDENEYQSFAFASHAFLSVCGIDQYVSWDDYLIIRKQLRDKSGEVYIISDDRSPFYSVAGIYVKSRGKLRPVRFPNEE